MSQRFKAGDKVKLTNFGQAVFQGVNPYRHFAGTAKDRFTVIGFDSSDTIVQNVSGDRLILPDYSLIPVIEGEWL